MRTPARRYARRHELLHPRRDGRRCARRRAAHRARRRADAGVHAGRHEGDGEVASTPTSCARSARRSSSATRTTCTSGPGEELIAELGGLHALHGLGRPDPHRLGRLPGVLAARHADRAPTTTASRSARSTTAAPERFTPELAARIQERLGSDVAMCLDICPPSGVPRARARGRGAPHDAVGASGSATCRAHPGSSASRSRRAASTPSSGSARPRSSSPLDFDGYAIGGLSVGEERGADVRRDDAAPRRSCRRTSRATSWASATPRA